MGLVIALLLSVTLQAPFVEAEAQILGAPSARTIDVTVRVEGQPTAVIARITDESGEVGSTALVPRGEGAFGQVIRLEKWEDLAISFEYLSPEGESSISSASTLSALGIEIPGAAPPVTAPPVEEGSGIDPRLLAAIAGALGAIVLAGFWSTGAMSDTLRTKTDDWSYAATAGADDAPREPESADTQGDDPLDTVESSAEG